MDKISSFLKKYRRFLKSDKEAKQFVLESLKTFSMNIPEDSLRVKDGILYFKVSPVLKNELFIRKKDILESLNSKQDQYHFFDIKF